MRMDFQAADVTRLLRDWSGGGQAALGQLTPLVYRELRGARVLTAIAASRIRLWLPSEWGCRGRRLSRV